MSLTRRTLGANQSFEVQPAHAGLRLLSGRLNRGSAALTDGAYAKAPDRLTAQSEEASWFEFGLWTTQPEERFQHLQKAEAPGDTVLFRLDEVIFGPGVCAYRHVHPGPGFRVLTEGELTIHSDSQSRSMLPGDAWFEPANTPVRAEASKTAPRTSFVRAMIVPPEFLGKPTIRILDPGEAALPRLQKTLRHFDQIIQVSG